MAAILLFPAVGRYRNFVCTLRQARRSTHLPCYHWRLCLLGCCCICLKQSAGVSMSIAITASFPHWAFCSVLQLILAKWTIPLHSSDSLIPLSLLRISAVLGLDATTNSFVTVSSSSSSSSSPSQSSVNAVLNSLDRRGWQWLTD